MTESFKDYYKIMGVNKDASAKDIKMAYRRLARKYHPDISKESNAEEKFKELGEAYEVLRDPKKKEVYDQYLLNRERPQSQKFYSNNWNQEGVDASSFDFFESLFGGKPFHYQQPSPDYHGHITISLEDAYLGTTQEIQIPKAGQAAEILKVKIPKGVKSGQKIRVSGKGGQTDKNANPAIYTSQ